MNRSLILEVMLGFALACLGCQPREVIIVEPEPSEEEKAEKAIKVAITQIKVFETPLQAYKMDLDEFPSTNQGLEALLSPPSDLANPDKWFGPYLKASTIPKDPWGNRYQYEYPGKQQQQDWPDIWSLGPDGQDGTEDDVGNRMEE